MGNCATTPPPPPPTPSSSEEDDLPVFNHTRTWHREVARLLPNQRDVVFNASCGDRTALEELRTYVEWGVVPADILLSDGVEESRSPFGDPRTNQPIPERSPTPETRTRVITQPIELVALEEGVRYMVVRVPSSDNTSGHSAEPNIEGYVHVSSADTPRDPPPCYKDVVAHDGCMYGFMYGYV